MSLAKPNHLAGGCEPHPGGAVCWRHGGRRGRRGTQGSRLPRDVLVRLASGLWRNCILQYLGDLLTPCSFL